jgi:hypothetical protein
MPRHPRRAVAGLATGLAAIGVAIGSGADFTAQSANPGNIFAAGILRIDNSDEGGGFLYAQGLTPGGEPQTGVVDIQNTGTIAGRFTLFREVLDDSLDAPPSEFARKVRLTVRDCGTFDDDAAPGCGDAGDVTIYGDGSLADMSEHLDLGRYEPGEKHRYQFAARLDESAGNDFQGGIASAGFVWDAVQTDR